MLISALHCMSKLSQEVIKTYCSSSPSPSPSSSNDMRGPLLSYITTETTLRLTNHCWEQVSEVCDGSMTQPCVPCCRDSSDMPCFDIIGLLTANESRTIICTNGIWFNVPLYRFLIGMSDHHSLCPQYMCVHIIIMIILYVCVYECMCVCVCACVCACTHAWHTSSCVADYDPANIRHRVLASSVKTFPCARLYQVNIRH